jgi:hypothetical protein
MAKDQLESEMKKKHGKLGKVGAQERVKVRVMGSEWVFG